MLTHDHLLAVAYFTPADSPLAGSNLPNPDHT